MKYKYIPRHRNGKAFIDHQQLAQLWITKELTAGEVPQWSGSGLVHDGRSRKRLIAEAMAEGYLLPVENEATRKYSLESFYAITPKAFNEVLSTPPGAPPVKGDGFGRHGWRFYGLPLGEQKWVLEHRDMYQLMIYDRDKCRPFDAAMLNSEPGTDGHLCSWDLSDRLYVQTAEWTLSVQQYQNSCEAKALESNNLPWAVSRLLPDEDEKALERLFKSDDHPFRRGMGTNPDQWPDRAKAMLAALKEQRDRIIADVRLVSLALDAVDASGGWEAFLAKYREELREAAKA